MHMTPTSYLALPALALVLMPYGATAAQDMTQGARPFEVVSIRPAAFESDVFAAGYLAGAAGNPCAGGGLLVSGTLVKLTRASVCDIVRIAYEVKKYQVIGVPAALDPAAQADSGPAAQQRGNPMGGASPQGLFYDIEARSAGPGALTPQEVRDGLREILGNRFHLRLHRETRNLAYYALVPAGGGPAPRPASDSCKPGRTARGLVLCGYTMADLAQRLTPLADKAVIDATGLPGKFDLEIPVEQNESADFGAMAGALRSHLKLRLEGRKGPVEVLVIDHIEKPTEN